MRVPVYPEDLLPQAAFKRLAKIIQKRWPGQSPVQLSIARETLSKGLGYANYHDLMKESVNWSRDAETLALSTTHTQLAAAIFSVLTLANDTSVPRSILDPFVEVLPLKALSTFKGVASRGVKVTTIPIPDLDQTEICPVNTTAPESEVPRYTCPPITHKPSKLQAISLGLDVFTHSDAIKRIVENSGSLRDRSLFALLETGLRGHVILGAEVSQVVSLETHMPSSKEISIEVTKAKPPLLLANTAVIEKYIREENLSADDYLFPSDDRKQPMSTSQLLRIFQSWEREAQLPRSTLTPSTLRRAAMAQLAAFTPPHQPGKRIADQLGHSFSSTTEHYFSLTTTAVNAALKTKKRRT